MDFMTPVLRHSERKPDKASLRRAETVLSILRDAFLLRGMEPVSGEAEMSIAASTEDNGLPLHFFIAVDAGLDTCFLTSILDCGIPEEIPGEVLSALNLINSTLLEGAFSLDLTHRIVSFRISHRYFGRVPDTDVIEYLIDQAGYAVKGYGERLIRLIKGELDIGGFAKEIG